MDIVIHKRVPTGMVDPMTYDPIYKHEKIKVTTPIYAAILEALNQMEHGGCGIVIRVRKTEEL